MCTQNCSRQEESDSQAVAFRFSWGSTRWYPGLRSAALNKRELWATLVVSCGGWEAKDQYQTHLLEAPEMELGAILGDFVAS